MEAALPIYKINGTAFTVDVSKGVLRQQDNPKNRMFFHDIRDQHYRYRVFYDRRTGRLSDLEENENMVLITLPQMVELDPERMSALYGVPVEQLKGITDYELLLNNPLVKKRLAGELPLIDLASDLFFVDVLRMELRLLRDPGRTIDLNKIPVAPDGSGHHFYYNTHSKQQAVIHPEIKHYPKFVVKLEIPIDFKLDPVGMADKEKYDRTEYLLRFPIQADMRAKVVPLRETAVAALIKTNMKAKYDRNHPEKAKLKR